MNSKPVVFRRVNGRVIPIRAENLARAGVLTQAGYLTAASTSAQALKPKPVKANKFLATGAMGMALTSGAIAGATFFSRGKKFWIGQSASLALDVGSAILGAAAHAGKGQATDRAKAVAKMEGKMQLAGYGVMGAVLLGRRSSRLRTLAYGRRAARGLSRFVGKVIRSGHAAV